MAASTLTGWSSGISVTRLLMVGAGASMLAVYLPVVHGLPAIGFDTVLLLCVYACGLLLQPGLWLFVLPVVTVGLDLAPWTGRFLFSEFDGLVVTTVALGLLAGRYHALPLGGNVIAAVLLTAYALLYLANVSSLSAFIDPPGRVFENFYYSSAYSYKVGKGFVWGVCLGWLWLSQAQRNRKQTMRWSLAGVIAACLTLFSLSLWERGTLSAVWNAENWWGIAHAVLDFSSDYRITGIFADMHTGGEVIDGLLILLLPLVLLPLFRGRDPVTTAILTAALLSLGYCIVVGVTRATWAAAGVAVIFAVLVQVSCVASTSVDSGESKRKAALLIFIPAVAVAYACWLNAQGGSVAMLLYGALVASVAAARLLPRVDSRIVWAVLAAALVVLGVMMLQAHTASRYATVSALSQLAVPLSVPVFGLTLYGLARREAGLAFSEVFRAAVILVVFPVGIALALGGFSMGDRLQSSAADLETRAGHWQRVIASADSSLRGRLLGSGVGSFPRRYIETYPETLAQIGSYEIRSGRPPLLRLGVGGDLAIVQRADFEEWTEYQVSLRTRSMDRGVLTLALCRQNQLVFDRWGQACVKQRVRYGELEQPVDEQGFQTHSVRLNSGSVPSGSLWQRWPVSFQLIHSSGGAPVDIAGLEMQDAWEEPALKNASFAKGSDYWFFHANFAHLPWHVKNLWLQAWFETGWLGLCLGAVVAGLAVSRGWRARATEPVVTAAALSVLCVIVLGAFGSPLDSSRVSSWFYALLLISLLQPLHHRDDLAASTLPGTS